MTIVRVDVTLPDELAAALEHSGVPVSALCERALEQAVRRVHALRAGTLDDAALPHWTARARTAVRLAATRTEAPVTTADLLHGLLTEGANLGVRLLPALSLNPDSLQADLATAPATEDDTPGWSGPAAAALELTLAEATLLGHNYVGGEHLLLGLLAEPDGFAGRTLRSHGADLPAARAAVTTALAGFAHARATSA
ncbi:Clp protease N-terminal domain-containing protein [Dactylosporangium sp. CS-047395]|uniref:Clp protease N-terminal domain-containing protein n=1 Tax=Dactylosporangium sp. CS-047395 TaxID=3239936 RepID=UPI003D9271DD